MHHSYTDPFTGYCIKKTLCALNRLIGWLLNLSGRLLKTISIFFQPVVLYTEVFHSFVYASFFLFFFSFQDAIVFCFYLHGFV